MSERLYVHGEYAPTLERSPAEDAGDRVDGARITPNISAILPVKVGPHILKMGR
jgi:hypothetical protein